MDVFHHPLKAVKMIRAIAPRFGSLLRLASASAVAVARPVLVAPVRVVRPSLFVAARSFATAGPAIVQVSLVCALSASESPPPAGRSGAKNTTSLAPPYSLS